MAPEEPPKLVILDLTQEDAGSLIGKLQYIEPRIDEQLRVRWSVDSQPEGFEAVGDGVAYILSRAPLNKIPVSNDARPEPLGNGRYRWQEGLSKGQPWLMFILILPERYTLTAPEPIPTSAKAFEKRIALYWILKGDNIGRTYVSWTVQQMNNRLSTEVEHINRESASGQVPLRSTNTFDLDKTTFSQPIDKNELAHVSKLLEIYQARRRILEIQAAQFGNMCPPYILLELDDLASKIQQLDYLFHSKS